MIFPDPGFPVVSWFNADAFQKPELLPVLAMAVFGATSGSPDTAEMIGEQYHRGVPMSKNPPARYEPYIGLFSPGTGMSPQPGLGQPGPVDMGVDFGGSDVGVAQQFLHDPQVGAPFKQMCGVGVAQGMR
jgi:hypothetical protein